MKEEIFKEKYKVYSQTIEKDKLISSDIDEIIQHLKSIIDQHPVARFISVFDHMAHTKELAEGQIDKAMLNARILLLCFGKVLDSPLILAVRPRSIGIAEMENEFVFSFMDAPKQELNNIMEKWIQSLIKQDQN